MAEPLWRRSRRLVSIVTVCAIVCIVTTIVLVRDATLQEETFKSVPSMTTTAAPIVLYIDEVAFDPVRQSMDLHLNVASGSSARELQYGGAFGRDVRVSIDDGDSEQIFDFHRSSVAAERLISLDARGEIKSYPFDHYHAVLLVSARERVGRAAARPVPVVATIWKGIPGWVTGIRHSSAVRADSALAIELTIQRTQPVRWFACVFYGLMVVIAACSLCIGGLVFTGKRKVESTIVGALAAMVFSVAVLRNVLPGNPPLGTIGDLAIFLWAEISVIAGLTLLVSGWSGAARKTDPSRRLHSPT